MRRNVLVRAITAVLLVASILGTPAEPVRAQALKCAAHNLSRSDQWALERAMKASLPEDVRIDTRPAVCRNPDSAFAWLETKHEPHPNAYAEWWSLTCNRRQRNWSCEPVQERELGMSLSFTGTLRKVTVRFDSHTSAERARDLVAAAFRVLETVAPAPRACGSNGEPEDAPQDAWDRMKTRYQRALNTAEWTASIESKDTTTAVSLFDGDGPEFTFGRDQQEPGNSAFQCWGEWVTVT